MTDKELHMLGCADIEESLTEDFGRPGTPGRDAFDRDAEAFILAERLKQERLNAGLTQEQLAAKIGTKKSYISRIENGIQDISGAGQAGQHHHTLTLPESLAHFLQIFQGIPYLCKLYKKCF